MAYETPDEGSAARNAALDTGLFWGVVAAILVIALLSWLGHTGHQVVRDRPAPPSTIQDSSVAMPGLVPHLSG